jgi:hypothetical protein
LQLINKQLTDYQHMPYRRLPNTDASRAKALRIAYQKGRDFPPFKLSFSQSSFQKVQSFLPSFERNLVEHKRTFSQQMTKSKDYQIVLKKARMYISHFIQVMNMAIIRGELAASTRTFYGMEESDSKIPSLNSEQDIIIWGEKLIQGETKRQMKGLSPISNPTIAVVKVRYENFLDAYKFQKTLQKSNNRTISELTDMRKKADAIILQIWNEVEAQVAELPDDIRREKAREYGVNYVYRKNEINRLNVFDNVTT